MRPARDTSQDRVGVRITQHCFLRRQRLYCSKKPHLGATYTDVASTHVQEGLTVDKTGEDKGGGMLTQIHMGILRLGSVQTNGDMRGSPVQIKVEDNIK